MSYNPDIPQLPEVSVWKARSTYATLITVAIVVLNLLGFNPEPWLRDHNLPSEVLTEVVWQAIPYITAAWAWWERKSPHAKLVFWRSKAP